MDLEKIILELTNKMAKFSTSVEIFSKQTSTLQTSFENLDKKINEMLVREAEKMGELKGFKNSILILVAIISFTINVFGVAAAYVR